jgi:hypothetical protein
VPGDFGGSTWDGTGDTADGGTKKRTGVAEVRGLQPIPDLLRLIMKPLARLMLFLYLKPKLILVQD